MSQKSSFLHEDENRWSGFLYDKDSCSEIVHRFFKPGKLTEYPHDRQTVIEAHDECRTIVTSNGTDFVRFMRDAQKKDNRKSCEDCWGLVIIPNKDRHRESALNKASILHGVRIAGRLVPWKAVGFANLRVTLEISGAVQVSKFERCQYCEEEYPFPADWKL